jgi:PadR family transcriptional regulator PadR
LSELAADLVKATIRGLRRSIILWLTNQEPRSGYGIMKEMKRLTGHDFHPGVIYPLLYELERKGFIDGRWTTERRRRIKYYSTTEKGRELLDRMRKLFEMPIREALKDLLGEVATTPSKKENARDTCP